MSGGRRINFDEEPEVAAAKQRVWQRAKELEFSDQVACLVKAHDGCGLAKERIARVLEIHGRLIGAAK